jgi:hypothetical protein
VRLDGVLARGETEYMTDLDDRVNDLLGRARWELDTGRSTDATRSDQEIADELNEPLAEVEAARDRLIADSKIIESEAIPGRFHQKV